MKIRARFVLPALRVTRAIGLVAGGALLALSVPGYAQVATNLDALPNTAPSNTHKDAHQTGHAPASKPSSSSKSATKSPPAQPQEHIPAGYTRVPALPTSPPIEPVLAPAFVPVIKHPPVPPEDIVPVKNAGTTTQTLEQQGLRILFVRDDSALSSETIASVQSLGEILAQYPTKRLLLKSYANLTGEDVSMPRRLALARALAVRSLLIRAGVATTRIYPIAYGRPVEKDGQPLFCNQSKEVSSSDTDSHRNPCPGNYLDILIEENPPITAEPFPDSQISHSK